LREKQHAAPSKLRWTWRARFHLGLSLPRYARIQHRLQFTRNTVQLLSRWKKMRAAEIGTVTGDFSTVTVALAFRDLLGN